MKTLHDLAPLEKNQLEMFFERIAKQVTFKMWYFGSLHIDRKITNTYTSVFRGYPADHRRGFQRGGGSRR